MPLCCPESLGHLQMGVYFFAGEPCFERLQPLIIGMHRPKVVRMQHLIDG